MLSYEIDPSPFCWPHPARESRLPNFGMFSTICSSSRLRSKLAIARAKTFDREKVLVQALQLFWRQGYSATSVEDLSRTLHLSRSSLYATFGDKHSLFLEALKLYSERVLQRTART